MKLAGWVVGAVLLVAGATKLGRGWELAESIANYRLLPAVAAQLLAVTLPWVELAAGASLLLRVWPRSGALLAFGLFASFAVAVASALARGLDVECGCFGTGGASRVGWPLLMLDLVCMGLCPWLWRSAAAPQPPKRTA